MHRDRSNRSIPSKNPSDFISRHISGRAIAQARADHDFCLVDETGIITLTIIPIHRRSPVYRCLSGKTLMDSAKMRHNESRCAGIPTKQPRHKYSSPCTSDCPHTSHTRETPSLSSHQSTPSSSSSPAASERIISIASFISYPRPRQNAAACYALHGHERVGDEWHAAL